MTSLVTLAPLMPARPVPGPLTRGPLAVATVIARLEGGAGVLALRGALAVSSATCRVTIITGPGGPLIEAARAAGLEVVVEPSLRAPIRPASDLRALARLQALFAARAFDVVHTHCAKAGAVGRLAARRAGVPRIVHTFHGFPFHEFQSRALRGAYVGIERRLGQLTSAALCVGAGVAAEAVRRELISPDRITTIGVSVDGPAGPGQPRGRLARGRPAGPPAGTGRPGPAAGRPGRRRSWPTDLPEGARGLRRRAGPPGPGGHRHLGRPR